MSTRSPRIARPLRLVALALACSGLAVPATTGPAAAQEAGSPSLVEVGRMDVLPGPGPSSFQPIDPGRSGWLLLDTRNRFAYQVFEVGNTTVIQSFNLDTLRPLRRELLAGIPVTSGLSDVAGVGATSKAGEVVHAFDEERGRLYLAMSDTGPQTFARTTAVRSAADGQRHLVRFVMIDEQKFNSGAADFAASFREPATQAHLHYFNVVGMAVTRHHVAAGGAGRLLVAFAHPAPPEIGAPTSLLHAHTLTRWNPESLGAPDRLRAGQENEGEASLPLVDPGAEKRELTDCGRASMGSTDGAGEGFSQWGILATVDAVYLACQLSPGNGAVVAVPLGAGGSLVSPLPLRSFPLAKPVADVLVDPGGGRLLVRTIEIGGSNTGTTVWVFDTAKARYTGAVALKQTTSAPTSTGIDPATGRLYTLVPDLDAGLRGGLQISDTRLDPAPPLENVRPDLAYSGLFSIRVDPPTRRVFVRRGLGASASHPAEPFYRVLRDDIPVTQPPPEIDDAAFTTDTAESDLTRASYLGTGTGYGARALMIGGLDAATTQGAVGGTGSPCGKDDREVLAGSVGQVNLSDLSVSAEAAAIDADARTRRAAPDVVDNCRNPSVPPSTPTSAVKPDTDTEELAFDQVDPETGERTGRNHYAATCLGDEGTKAMEGFSTPKTRREAFKAEVTCAREEDDAAGRATGALVFDTAAGQVRVAHSSSEVTVKREAGKGIEVRVDSIARGIDIGPAASIGVVRTTAVSKATGRSGRAEGTFERTICGVTVTGQPNQPSCLGQDQQRELVDRLNAVLGARGRVSLRRADPKLLAGSESGYRSAVQRHGDDLFEDRSVTKDFSIAVPGLELMFFQGDGNTAWGAGRQVLHLAGAQASTSYGITCLYGRLGNGRCARFNERDEVVVPASTTTEFVEGDTVYETLPGQTVQVAVPGGRSTKAEPRWKTVVYAPARAAAEALRLLFNNPRELGLMAAVWALLYAPCYLGERRRSINGLRARRASVGVGGLA